MARALRTTLVWIVLLLASCAGRAPAPPSPTPAPAEPPAPSTAGPIKIEWRYKGSTDYETNNPGLGVGKRYESAVGWIDVYRFGAGRDNWLEGTSDPGFKAQIDEIADNILQAAKAGHYRNVSFEPPKDVYLAGHKFRNVVARFEFRGKLIESHTLLTALGGRLLKYRMSFAQPAPPALDEVISDFVELTIRDYERDNPASVS